MKTPFSKSILLAAGLSLFLPSCVETTTAGHHGPDRHYDSGSGRIVRTLPSGYREENFDGVRYYHHSGTYYRQATDGYVVVDAPRPRTNSYRGDGPQNQRRASDSRSDSHNGRSSSHNNNEDRSRSDDKPGTGNWRSRDANQN